MKRINSFIKYVGNTISWLNVALIILIGLDVLFRYFFSFSKNWILELEWHFFALVFILGSAYALQEDKHVRVDVFYQKFSEKTKTIINLLGTIVFLFPWCYLVITTSYKFAINSWYIREGSNQPGGLPARYMIKSMIVVGFLLLLIQGVALVFKYSKQLIRNEWK